MNKKFHTPGRAPHPLLLTLGCEKAGDRIRNCSCDTCVSRNKPKCTCDKCTIARGVVFQLRIKQSQLELRGEQEQSN